MIAYMLETAGGRKDYRVLHRQALRLEYEQLRSDSALPMAAGLAERAFFLVPDDEVVDKNRIGLHAVELCRMLRDDVRVVRVGEIVLRHLGDQADPLTVRKIQRMIARSRFALSSQEQSS